MAQCDGSTCVTSWRLSSSGSTWAFPCFKGTSQRSQPQPLFDFRTRSRTFWLSIVQ